MRPPLLAPAALLLVLAALAGDLSGQAPPAPPAEDEAQVLGRGPLHEAFATPTTSQTRSSPLVAKKPPDPIPEQPPEQQPEGNNVQWISGYWAWDDEGEDFIWVSGFWRDLPPGRQWLPGYWTQSGTGWQWVAGFWTEANRTEVQYLPEPPATVDMGPSTPAPSAESIYVPGVWVYVETAYRWRPGHWARCYPDWVWSPAYYCWTPSGYLFVDGHWDYALQRRGLLFAPVRFSRPLWTQANWYFQPRYTLFEPALLSSLFIRPERGSFYFGDYYAAQYERRGFVPWISYQPYRGGSDPLFAYYRWRHRDDRRWETSLRTVYDQRRSGEAPRPAHNLVQQNKQIQELQANPKVNVSNVQDLTVLVSLNQLAKDKTQVKLQPVSKEQQTKFKEVDREVRAAQQQRHKVETQLRGPAQEDKKIAPRTARLELPKSQVAATTGKEVKAPPVPTTAQELPDPKVQPKADPKVEPKADPKVQPKTDPKADPKVEPKIDPKVQPKIDPKVEPKIDPKVQPKVDPKIDPKVQPKVDPKIDPKVQPKVEPKLDPKVEPKAQPKIDPKPNPDPEPKQRPKVDPEPKRPKTEPDMPVPNPENPKTPPAPRPQPKLPAVDPEPAPRPEPKPMPKLPVPDPEPRPAPPKVDPKPPAPAPRAQPPAPPKADPTPPVPAPKAQPPAPPPPKGPDRPKGRDKDGKDAAL